MEFHEMLGELTNCVNCSAPIDYSLEVCPYCGTPYHKKADRNHIKENLLQIKINVSQEMQIRMLMNGLITNNSLRRFHGL